MIENRSLGHVKISAGDDSTIFSSIETFVAESGQSYCIPLNLTKYVVSKKDQKLQNAINSADLVLADGIPIVWLSKRAGYADIYRITGIDLAEKILSVSKARGWRVYFLGASEANLKQAVSNLKLRFIGLDVAGSHHGYFRQNEIEDLIGKINASAPDILLLGLGMPQKEYFIHDQMTKLKVRFCLAVGGAFDVWADVKKRTPKTIQNAGLEWLYRSLYDKSRAQLIAKYGLVFLKDLVFYKK
jgi:N-acetylglucosaminyldiphosphoundecaprenol N-acetyl-beta-D-mannosaminyltransferase